MIKVRYLKTFFFFVLILFTSQYLYAQTTKVFSEAKGSGKDQTLYKYERWNFHLGNKKYEIKKNGKGTENNGKNRTANFRIKLERGEELERIVYFSQYQGDIILICESVLGDGSGGLMARLNGSSLRTKWQSSIPAFNIAKGLIENNSAYLAAIGFIGKINLETGKFIWKQDDLYLKYDESGAFNVFLTPRINRNLVIFKEADVLGRGFDHQIHVNKTSGKIVKVILK